jgi:hypothetical protein
MPTTTYENSGNYASGWNAYCAPLPTGVTKKAGAACTSDAQCASGVCIGSGKGDGYCLGQCNSSGTGQCDAARGVECDRSGYGLFLNDGKDGVPDTTDDQYGRASICGGKRCTADSDCTGLAPAGAPARSCQVIFQPVGNSFFYTGNTLRTACEPSVGTKRSGASCSADSECASGDCYNFGTGAAPKRACLGGCNVTGDCATNATCLTLTVQWPNITAPVSSAALKVCKPN